MASRVVQEQGSFGSLVLNPPGNVSSSCHSPAVCRRLVGGVRAVGPAISCEGSPFEGDEDGAWRRNPHVQSYLLATDRIGLEAMQGDGNVFRCHRDRWDAIWCDRSSTTHAHRMSLTPPSHVLSLHPT